VPEIGLPVIRTDRESVHHLFVIEVEERDRLARRLAAHGVQTGLHYPIPVHLQPAYRDLGLGEGSFPIAERFARRCLSLPMYPGLTTDRIDYVCDLIEASVRS
jgi:dTDP-4-amino-4,6-dideoxygalactose transaminase